MTAYINKLKDVNSNQQLPVTHERAVRDDNGTTAETKFQNLEGAMDKAYVANSDNGMGRITLHKNMVSGVNTLTQSMMQATNTIYVIPYDFTLGEAITIPENCVLQFDGGSVSGEHTITGNNTKISSNAKISKNIIYAGSFACGIDLNWIYDLTMLTQSYLTNIVSVFKEVKFGNKTYTSETGLHINGINDVKLVGDSNSEIKYVGDISDLDVIRASATLWVQNCNNFTIENIKLNQDKEWMARPLSGSSELDTYRTMRLYRFPNLILTNVNKFKVKNVESSYCQANFILQSSSNGVFENCYVHHSLADGFLFDGANNVTVTGCRGYAIDDDFLSSAATYYNGEVHKSYNLTYSDNKVTDSYGALLCAEGTDDVTFVNCIGTNLQSQPIKLGNATSNGMQIPGHRQIVSNVCVTLMSAIDVSPLISGTSDYKSDSIVLSNVCIKSPTDTTRFPFVGTNVTINNCVFDNVNLFANISDKVCISNCCFTSAMYLYLMNSTNINIQECVFVNNRYADTDPYPIRVAGCENVYLSFIASKPIAFMTNSANNVHIYKNAWGVIRDGDGAANFTNIHTEILRQGNPDSTAIPLQIYKNGERAAFRSGVINIYNGKLSNNIIGNTTELNAFNAYINVGTMAYNTTLEKPVWYKGNNTWILADGTIVPVS